ncbi:MAG: hypothetical protein HY908_11270 [Myxococcales bacterium]|nr:hypothetical protein [Myxococcales bacterium]
MASVNPPADARRAACARAALAAAALGALAWASVACGEPFATGAATATPPGGGGGTGGAPPVTSSGGSSTASGGQGGGADCASADLATSSQHCGACFHDCFGGACTGGVCGPVMLVSGDFTGGALAVAGNVAYWADELTGTIHAVGVDGSGLLELATAVPPVGALAVDDTHVYFSGGTGLPVGNVGRVPRSGGGIEILAPAIQGSGGVAVDGGFVYFGEGATSRILRKPKGPGAVQVLASMVAGVAGGQLVATADHLFWTGRYSNTVATVGKTGTAPAVLAAGQSGPLGLAAYGGFIYFTKFGAGGVARGATEPGLPVSTLAQNQSGPVSIAVDSDFVYWLNETSGEIVALSTTGGTPMPIVTSPARPSALAVDAEAIYFTLRGENGVGGGGLARVRKPVAP